MRPTRTTLGVCSTAALALAACSVFHETLVGSGVRLSESRPVPAFERIAIAGSVRVEVQQGPEHSLRLSLDDNLLPHVVTEVEDGELEVRFERNLHYRSREPLQVWITAPALSGISAAGSVELTAEGLDTARLELDLAGSGSLGVRGRADEVEIDVAGSGEFDLSGLAARRATVSIAGSGDVVLQAEETLEVSIAGSGDVRYLGRPTLSQSIAGSGSIRPFQP